MTAQSVRKSKHHMIFEHLHNAIMVGQLEDGQRIPSESELGMQFEASRPTVARALRDLEQMGLVVRRVGSGTYVRHTHRPTGGLFGLLIPGLGNTEIFDPICSQMARDAHAHHHTLLWGHSTETGVHAAGHEAEELCRRYIKQKVAGIFFAPLELAPDKDDVNQRIVGALDQAGIPVILLDRDIVRFPQRSEFDLVGIDNHRGGYLLTEHLLKLGAGRVDFLARRYSAPTVEMRVAGYQQALWRAGRMPEPAWVHYGDPDDLDFVRTLVENARVQAVICANDVTAAHLMHSLDTLGYKVPEDVRVVGFDDVKYAKLLRVPLTTLRQPCRDIGTAAVNAMIERIANPDLPVRDILLDAQLVVRKSCGAALQ
jgi:GntR family transcriptional regulator of arabinose operon